MNKRYVRMLKIINELDPVIGGGHLVDLRLAHPLPDGDPVLVQGFGWIGHVYQAYLVNEHKDHQLVRRLTFAYRRAKVRAPGEWVCIQTDCAVRQPNQSVREITGWRIWSREVPCSLSALWESSNWKLGMPIWRSYATGMWPFLLP